MFNNKKPALTLAEEIDLYTSDLKELYKLRDQAEQHLRLVTTDRAIYAAEVDRHSQAVKTCQLVISKLLQKAERRAGE